MEAAKERQMIVGSEGGLDYLVIAKDQGFVLGIKPLLVIGHDQSQFGFRVRMQRDEEAKTDIENKAATLEVMQQVFAEIPWGKRSSTRFSTMLFTGLSYGVEFLDKIEDAALEGYGELIDGIEAKIAPVAIIDRQDANKFVEEKYKAVVEEVRGYMKKQTAQQQTQAGVADVLQFPSKKGDDGDIE